MKKIIVGVVVIIAILAIWRFWPQPDLGWQTYRNTSYGYSVEYPDSIANIYTNNEYSGDDLTDEMEIRFGVPGKTTLLAAELDYVNPEILSVFEGKKEKELIEKRLEFISIDLKSYAEKIREVQINDTNPYTNAKVGDFKEIIFAGKTAYSFSLDDAFSNSTGGGYTLGTGQTHNYVITENSKGQKMIVHYLIASETYPEGIAIAKKMVGSFKFE